MAPGEDDSDHGHHDQQPAGRTELGDRLEHVGRRRRLVIGTELGCRSVEAGEAAVLVDPVEDPADRHRRDEDDSEQEDERGTADDPSVHVVQHASKRLRGVDDEPAFLALRIERHGAPREDHENQIRQQAGGDHQAEHDQHRHDTRSNSRCRTIRPQKTPYTTSASPVTSTAVEPMRVDANSRIVLSKPRASLLSASHAARSTNHPTAPVTTPRLIHPTEPAVMIARRSASGASPKSRSLRNDLRSPLSMTKNMPTTSVAAPR